MGSEILLAIELPQCGNWSLTAWPTSYNNGAGGVGEGMELCTKMKIKGPQEEGKKVGGSGLLFPSLQGPPRIELK